jgi:hypothetical protein
MGHPTGKKEKVSSAVIRIFRISGIWSVVFVLLVGCGGFQFDTKILSPSHATATAIEQIKQAEPASPTPEIKIQTPTVHPDTIPTPSIAPTSPTMSGSDFISWDSLINYDLLKDVDWSVYSANLYNPPSGFRRYALAVPTAMGTGTQNEGNELYIRNYDPVTDYSARLDRVTIVFQCILNEVVTTQKGKEQKVWITGEPGSLWTNIVEPDKHQEYLLLFEHDGANYTFFGPIDLPSADSDIMGKYQTLIFYVMSSLILD